MSGAVKLDTVVFQLVRDCENECPDCFFNSRPGLNEGLGLEDVICGFDDLHAANAQVGEFVFTGGEPTLWKPLQSAITDARKQFADTKIRIDTNGINLYKNPALFPVLDADIYHISVDTFHEQGVGLSIKNGSLDPYLRGVYIDSQGKSRLLEHMLENQREHGFSLTVRWTSNRHDDLIFEKFRAHYNDNVEIVKKEVTATGRANALSPKVRGDGYCISDNPENFACLMGSSLLLAIDGFWYACYHPVNHTRISKSGDPSFSTKFFALTSSPLYVDLPLLGMQRVLEYIADNEPDKRSEAQAILETKFWYRCEPCVSASECGLYENYQQQHRGKVKA